MVNYFNYILTLIGLGMIIVSLFLIFSDKLKGEGIYFDLYVKEQEIRKAILEADEMIDELKYTTETLSDEIKQSLIAHKNTLNATKIRNAEVSKKKKTLSDEFKKNNTNKNSLVSKNTSAIYKYYNEGMDIGEIAKVLGIGKGEVSLILSLYNGDAENGNI